MPPHAKFTTLKCTIQWSSVCSPIAQAAPLANPRTFSSPPPPKGNLCTHQQPLPPLMCPTPSLLWTSGNSGQIQTALSSHMLSYP